jgi:sugar phosphate isomerase/epimerase
MISAFYIAAAPLVMLFQDATGDLRIATPSIDDARVIRSIGVASRRGAKPLVLVVPKAAPIYVDGKPMLGRDPFAESANELAALKATC